jgi:DNA-binding GntR family transcriptional regulator
MVTAVSDLAAPDDRRPGLVYERVAGDIAARIRAGELAPGTRLRAERELAAYYGIAYATMRKATRLLREQGYINTIHGQGTYIREREAWPDSRG